MRCIESFVWLPDALRRGEFPIWWTIETIEAVIQAERKNLETLSIFPTAAGSQTEPTDVVD